MKTLLVAVAVAAATAAGSVSGQTASVGGSSVAADGFASVACTAGEKAHRVAALKKYARAMAKARRAYFRTHHGKRARRAFVKRQQKKLRKLRRAAACRVVIPAGARIETSIPIPNNGGVGVGAGSVWVVDRVARVLYRIDPATNSVAAQVNGVVGAAPTVGDGAVWVPSGIVLNTLLRFDLATGAATRIATGPTDDEMPITAVWTPGALWVGNHHGGTVARVDTQTKNVVASIPWGAPGGGGPYHMTTDGSSIWVTASRTQDVTEIDTATNAVVKRIPVPAGTCGGIAVDASAVWVTSGFDRPYACWLSLPTVGLTNIGLSRIDRASGAVSRIDVGGRPIDVRSAFGSIWVLLDAPKLELVRLDPTTYRVVGRLRLWNGTCHPEKTGGCPGADYATALEVGFGSLWVRVDVSSAFSASEQPPAAVLRIAPT